ncbi:patched domain-containing protein 3-like [Centruroides sculpturatus]|uniref:patched domain-containing protein 3-like n=1 Tax=Centruroides sculpturatus TaxID=218467 RepID=UPI000C6D8366|nr:patched domain-containing protein 3-like [Centruroides sculpturatus]
MKYDYINRFISAKFRILGLYVGRHPFIFIIVPLIIASILSLGLKKYHLVYDTEYLYCPRSGRAIRDREVAETLFPPDENNFDIMKMMRFGRMGMLLMEAKDGGSLLRENILKEIKNIDKIIQNITVNYHNKTYQFEQLCLRSANRKCVENYVLSLSGKMEDIKNNKFRMKFPFEVKKESNKLLLSVVNFGGVTTDENDYILESKAIRLTYLLKYTTKEWNEISLEWESKFLETVSRLKSKRLNFYKFIGGTFDNEFHKATEMVLPFVLFVAPLMAAFAVITSMTKDWVTSKPWIGIAGCICPIIAGMAAFGLLLFCGAEYIDLNISIIFLLLGIGLDDSFVLLAAWRRTDSNDSVEKRISDAYSEAATSITITSLTNFISFTVGMTTPYKVIQIFSVYAALSILFDYLVQVTLFGGILALSGFREQNKLHSLFCIGVNPTKHYISENALHRFLHVGLIKESADLEDSNIFLKIYKDFIGKALTQPSVKLMVILFFIIYISGAIYCLGILKQGFDYRIAVPKNSYSFDFITKHYQYFVQYPHGIQVIINQTLDYSDPQVQKDVTEIVRKFSTAPYMAGQDMVDSWLKLYLLSLNDTKLWLSYRGYDMTKSEDFLKGFVDVFLKIPYYRRYRNDVVFNKNMTQIIASRYLVASKDINDFDLERQMLTKLWELADSCKYPVYVHNYWFAILNQHINIKESSVQAILIAALTVTVMFFLFVPHLLCAVCVALTIASVLIGVIGYMSLLGINLDTVSMLILIMATGLSVDYAAHISYAYITAKQKNPNEKTKRALEVAGHPIFQGCITSIVAVAILGLGPSYSFIIVFKIVTLQMVFAFLHGIFLLPVLLNVLESFILCLTRKFPEEEEEHSECDVENKEAINFLMKGEESVTTDCNN